MATRPLLHMAFTGNPGTGKTTVGLRMATILHRLGYKAYSLSRPENERDYGQETIEILLQVMESERENLVVILAGYKDRMERFFAQNPGLRSRIAHHIEFADYTLEELLEIGELMLQQQNYALDEEARAAFRRYVECRMRLPNFANARSIRNAIDRFKLRQAYRLYERGGVATEEDLRRITAGDILNSRVFRECADTTTGDPER